MSDKIKVRKNSIADIARFKLCCSCGACAWACPEKAISYIETVGGYLLPEIDLTACTECGVCKSVCPGAGLAPALTDHLPRDPFTGTALQTYVGKATDEKLYTNSQSGGIVSAILAHALETGEIAGAITAVMVAGKPPRTVAKLVKNIEEIQQAQKSKYCPVPLLRVLDEIEELKRPVAIVGVACQIHGLYNILEQFPNLKKKISFTIGIICDRTMTYGAMDYLLKRAHVTLEDSKILHFRDKTCGGYPGDVNVVCSSGISASLPSSERMRIKDFFTPARCRICFDKMNVFADITVGDPWGIDGVDRIGGESVAIIRTETGNRIFQSAIANSAMTVREISYNAVLGGQGIEQKRSQWRGYIEAWNNLSRPIPNFYEQVRKSSVPQRHNSLYQDHLRHALALDQYPSRDALVTAVEKHFFFQKIASLPSRMKRKMIRKFKKIVNWSIAKCS